MTQLCGTCTALIILTIIVKPREPKTYSKFLIYVLNYISIYKGA